MNTAAYIKNHTVSHTLGDKSPIEIWTSVKPDISHFKVFGCQAMVFVPKQKRTKFDAKSKQYLFVGYCDGSKGYRLIDPVTHKIVESRDVKFLEAVESGNFSNLDSNNGSFEFIAGIEKSASEEENGDIEDETINISDSSNDSHDASVVSVIENTNTNYRESSLESTLINNDNDPEYEPDDLNISPIEHPIATERQRRNVQPIERYDPSLYFIGEGNTGEPLTVAEALNCDENVAWKRAMDDEYKSIMDNKTWELVDLPSDRKPITCKWVFKLKKDQDGKILRYKARLVARGCSQRSGIDYTETFSPVIRYSSMRLLMAIAVKFDLEIEQMDAVTAFLQGEVEETIFMRQPECYDDGSGRVCVLKKAIYGLKQASRQWNKKLNDVLMESGFKRCKTDSCIYVRRNQKSIVIVAVYVDDLLIFSNNDVWKNELKKNLMMNFSMKDLGKVSGCLGLRIVHNREAGTIKMDQSSYIEEILRRFKMTDCNPVRIPMDPNERLTRDMSPNTPEEITEMENVPYQAAVGSILFLTQCTRPDITFAIGNLSQFNNNPGRPHWNAVKRLISYLKGTIDHKLLFSRKSDTPIICGYTDADWASNVDDRKSCTGYVFKWFGGAISWVSKRQPTVALSSTEAEYMAIASSCQEAVWCKQLIEELINEPMAPIKIFCDNRSAVCMSQNNLYSARTKHIDIRHHFVRELIESKKVVIDSIGTDLMIADNLTKPVNGNKHAFCTNKMGLI